ncbi:Mor transcription activator family protein [Romboutsia sedimentorum]|uniref:Mor transcription activator family protein n=1 Tax=Romboutsia sedimentorum TaxID=1368474 RepID=UPI0024DEB9B8|nr:Mor transcription activator family protein [Romboutsia sedimentorum]MDK2586323.1 Mor transcription activator family protein [Romboutsia sedimentorum]
MKIENLEVSDKLDALLDIIGEYKFLEVTKLYGGNNVYIPTYSSAIRSSRNRDIVKRYNGVNAVGLACEYGISVTQLKNIANGDV